MIDIVIPYRRVIHDEALRFALRSVEKNLEGVGNVFVIGDQPTWGRNLIHLPFKDKQKGCWREQNIYRKILLACEHPGVSDNFLFMNDDHFLLEPYGEAVFFPTYYHGILYGSSNNHGENVYGITLRHTWEILGRWAQDYDCHCPIVYNKNRFRVAHKDLDWSREWGYAIKSVYCAMNGIEGEYMPDCKIRRPERYIMLKEHLMRRKWFSTDDKAMNNDMVTLLQEFFPEASKYEA